MRFPTSFARKSSAERLSRQLELSRFVTAMFFPDDLVEVRAIANPSDTGAKCSAIRARFYESAGNIPNRFDELASLNAAGANIYFGVNPRTVREGRKSAVARCRCVWVDLDQVTLKEAEERISKIMPSPSLVVSSGHGVHVYYLLNEPVDVADAADRTSFEDTLKGFYKSLGADATQDVTRLLRFPGFFNVKSDPVACSIVSCDPFVRFEFADFGHFKPRVAAASCVHRFTHRCFPPHGATDAVRRIVSSLDDACGDRSRRDFSVICKLLRLGLDVEDIWRLVQSRSKFATNGRRYFDRTIGNAMRRLSGR